MKDFPLKARPFPKGSGARKYGAAPITQESVAQPMAAFLPPGRPRANGVQDGEVKAGARYIPDRRSPSFGFAQESLASPAEPR
jgi:hypothetical protein